MGEFEKITGKVQRNIRTVQQKVTVEERVSIETVLKDQENGVQKLNEDFHELEVIDRNLDNFHRKHNIRLRGLKEGAEGGRSSSISSNSIVYSLGRGQTVKLSLVSLQLLEQVFLDLHRVFQGMYW